MIRIPFNKPPYLGEELKHITAAVESRKISGDGEYTKKCTDWLSNYSRVKNVLLTTSCSHALEMAAILTGIEAGDEVIMPSYTFVSTANAFALRGAKIVFLDIRPDTLNINEALIEEAITKKTKAIVPVHYAGVACEMDEINRIAKKYGITVIEDAAQGLMSSYKGTPLGGIGDMGCFSFHETKNYSMGEGGALVIKDKKRYELAEIIREKGTDRSQFLRGEVDKYSWVALGSSYLPSDINAAYLYPQLLQADEINQDRLKSWNLYYSLLKPFCESSNLELPYIPRKCIHNAHMFYIKVRDLTVRTALIQHLKERNILAVSHYVPLHTAAAGSQYSRFHGEDIFTTRESNRILRLPMYYGLLEEEIIEVVSSISSFFVGKGRI